MQRRSFLKGSAAGLGGLTLAGPLSAFAARAAGAAPATSIGYGALAPVASLTDSVQYLALPPGFSYYAFSPLGGTMADGTAGGVPSLHDGMACFPGQNGKLLLVRNHEQSGNTGAFVPAAKAWDPLATGGCTILEFDPLNPPNNINGVPTWAALSGTIRNCMGGPTPWGSWLTCEETTQNGPTAGKAHGYVFEVPASTPMGNPVTAVPYTQMGRFAHEAVAIDPNTNYAYETEDATPGGVYRFVPTSGHDYTSGTLAALKIVGQTSYNTITGQTVGVALPVEWSPIANPDSIAPSCFSQAAGAAIFSRPEGAWWDEVDQVVYFTCTDGGAAAAGQIWAYSPSASTLTLVYESPNTTTLLKPDNITVSPSGNVWICEDTDRARQTFIRGLADDGTLFTFAQNIRTDNANPGVLDEFAGACFSPDGKWLFVSIQTPGVTFAITGPFDQLNPAPDPVVPEVPIPALLGVTAAAAMGGAVYLRNRANGGSDAATER